MTTTVKALTADNTVWSADSVKVEVTKAEIKEVTSKADMMLGTVKKMISDYEALLNGGLDADMNAKISALQTQNTAAKASITTKLSELNALLPLIEAEASKVVLADEPPPAEETKVL